MPGITILGKGFACDLPDHISAELIDRLNGLPRVDAVDELARSLTKARNGGARYRPSEHEQEILFGVLDVWRDKVGEVRFPPPAKALRYRLFDEVEDRAS